MQDNNLQRQNWMWQQLARIRVLRFHARHPQQRRAMDESDDDDDDSDFEP